MLGPKGLSSVPSQHQLPPVLCVASRASASPATPARDNRGMQALRQPDPRRRPLCVAMLHGGPVAGEVKRNFAISEQCAIQAAAKGATLFMMPELALTGYDFVASLGGG